MKPQLRAGLEQVLEALQQETGPNFHVAKADASMDDVTLFVVVGLGLLYLYLSITSPQAANVAITVSPDPASFPDPSVPQAQAPSPLPQPGAATGGILPNPQPPAPQSGNTGSADQIDLSRATIAGGSPGDIANWPIVTSLSVSVQQAEIDLSFTDPGWPDVIPPGFTGPIQYTVWAFAFIGGQWIGAGMIERWRGLYSVGQPGDAGSTAEQLAKNWWYYVAGMSEYVPQPGDQVAFMVANGDERDGKGPFDGNLGRSNVVLVTL